MIKKYTNGIQTFTIVQNAPKVKRKLLNDFEGRSSIRLPVAIKTALMTQNFKVLGQSLALLDKQSRKGNNVRT